MKAKKAVIPVWNEKDLGANLEHVGLAGSPTAVTGVFAPPRRAGGEMLSAGSASEAARLLLAKIREMRPGQGGANV
jgi:electron transfer flavoprotein alpha/beta subunit